MNLEQEPGKIIHVQSSSVEEGGFVLFAGKGEESNDVYLISGAMKEVLVGDGSIASEFMGAGVMVNETNNGNDVIIFTSPMDDEISWPSSLDE